MTAPAWSPHTLCAFRSRMSVVNFISNMEGPIMGARYISAITLSCLLYDHFTHFDDELEDIWFNLRQRTWLKVMFLCGRYTNEVLVIYTMATMGGFSFNLTLQECQTYIVSFVFLFNIAVIGTEGVVIYRIRSLWDHNRHVTYAIAAMFTVVLVTMAVGTAFETTGLPEYISTLPGFPECLLFVPGQRPLPYMITEAAVLVVWDIFNIAVFTSNTLASPYQCSAEVFSRFKRDGGRYFIYLLAVRSLHLFMSAFGKESRFSTIPLASALGVIINARIFHRIGRDFEGNPKHFDALQDTPSANCAYSA